MYLYLDYFIVSFVLAIVYWFCLLFFSYLLPISLFTLILSFLLSRSLPLSFPPLPRVLLFPLFPVTPLFYVLSLYVSFPSSFCTYCYYFPLCNSFSLLYFLSFFSSRLSPFLFFLSLAPSLFYRCFIRRLAVFLDLLSPLLFSCFSSPVFLSLDMSHYPLSYLLSLTCLHPFFRSSPSLMLLFCPSLLSLSRTIVLALLSSNFLQSLFRFL